MFSILRLMIASQGSSKTWMLIVRPPKNPISAQQSIPVHDLGNRQTTELGRGKGIVASGHSTVNSK